MLLKQKRTIRTYSELIQIPSFIDRFKYLAIGDRVGEETFGSKRYLNQLLYRCKEWKAVRRDAIIRDDGCDLGCGDRRIGGPIYVHHLNPITIEQILDRDPTVFDLENLICASYDTHEAIHYGDESLLILDPVERMPNDTIPWR